jgi:ubiquinone/menaquinone biosynthesis C-methylase UbiE
MSVAAHLGIRLDSYDEQIRAFIPYYDEMLDAAAACLRGDEQIVVDLGVGTGALAARCLDRAPRATVIGIDSDPAILRLAASRLGARGECRTGNFMKAPLPAGDAVVASLSLHHVRTATAKLRLFRRIAAALPRQGRFVSADCHPSHDRHFAALQRTAWVDHLRRTYSAPRARALLSQWAREDVYRSLDVEIALARRGGIAAEVMWRNGSFAVIAGTTI